MAMPTRRISTAVLGLFALLQALPATAQGLRLSLLPESRVWVDGTSNKTDWTVKATQLSGFVNLQLKNDALQIGAGGFTVVAKSLVSEHGVIMDRLMYGALKTDTYAEIVYQLVSATATAGEGGKYALATQGRVTIAGVTKDVVQTVAAERLPNGTIRFTGSQPLLMSEFGMKPPTAMFGALRTGNRVVVNFELIVKP
jgi:polyisoprenoid-binding protein YceI